MPGVIIIRRALRPSTSSVSDAQPPFEVLLYRRAGQVDHPFTWSIPYGEYEVAENAVQQDLALPSDFRQWAQRRGALRVLVDLSGGGVGLPTEFLQLPDCIHRRRGLKTATRSNDGVCLPPGLTSMLETPGVIRPLHISSGRFVKNIEATGEDDDGMFVFLVPPNPARAWRPRGIRESRNIKVDDTFHEHGAFYGYIWANLDFMRRNPSLPPVPGSSIHVVPWIRDLFSDIDFNEYLMQQLGYLEEQRNHDIASDGNLLYSHVMKSRISSFGSAGPKSPPASSKYKKNANSTNLAQSLLGNSDSTEHSTQEAQPQKHWHGMRSSGSSVEYADRQGERGFLLLNATTHRYLRCIPVKDNTAVISTSADWRECEPFKVLWHSESKKRNLEKKKQDPATPFFLKTIESAFYLRSMKNGEVIGTKEANMTKAAKSPMESWQLWRWKVNGDLSLASGGGGSIMSHAHKRNLMISPNGDAVVTTSGISPSLRQEWLLVSPPGAVGRDISIGVNHLGGYQTISGSAGSSKGKYLFQLQEGISWLKDMRASNVPIKVYLRNTSKEKSAKTLVDLVSDLNLPYSSLVENEAHRIISFVCTPPNVGDELWWSTADGAAFDDLLHEEEEEFFGLVQYLLNAVHRMSKKIFILQNEDSDSVLQRAAGVRYPSRIDEAMVQRYILFLRARQRGIERARRLYQGASKSVTVLHAIDIDSVAAEKDIDSCQVVYRVVRSVIPDALGYSFGTSAWHSIDCGEGRVALKKRLLWLKHFCASHQSGYGKARFPQQIFLSYFGSTESEVINTKMIHIVRMILEECRLSLAFYGSLYGIRRDKLCCVRREDDTASPSLDALLFISSIAALPEVTVKTGLLWVSLKTSHGTFITSNPQDMRHENLSLLHYPEALPTEQFAVLPHDDGVTVSLQTRNGLFVSVPERDTESKSLSRQKRVCLVQGIPGPSEKFLILQDYLYGKPTVVSIVLRQSGGALSARSDGDMEVVGTTRGECERFELIPKIGILGENQNNGSVGRNNAEQVTMKQGVQLICKCSRSMLPPFNQAKRKEIWNGWKSSMRDKAIMVLIRGQFENDETAVNAKQHATNVRHQIFSPLMMLGCRIGFFIGCSRADAIADSYRQEFGPSLVLGAHEEGGFSEEWDAASCLIYRATSVAESAHFLFDFMLMLRADCLWREPFNAWGCDCQKISFPFQQPEIIPGGVKPVCARAFHAVPRVLLPHFQRAVKSTAEKIATESPGRPHWANLFIETRDRAGQSNVHICIDGDWPSEAVDIGDPDSRLPNPFYSLGERKPMCNRGGFGHHMTLPHPLSNGGVDHILDSAAAAHVYEVTSPMPPEVVGESRMKPPILPLTSTGSIKKMPSGW